MKLADGPSGWLADFRIVIGRKVVMRSNTLPYAAATWLSAPKGSRIDRGYVGKSGAVWKCVEKKGGEPS